MEKNDVREAIKDIALIKQTMKYSRVQRDRLSYLFFIYGTLQFLFVGAMILWDLFGDRGVYSAERLQQKQIYIRCFLCGSQLLYGIIAVFYFLWRNGMKKTENNETLCLYDAWGYALFTVPSVWILIFGSDLCFGFLNTGTEQAVMLLLLLCEQMMLFVGLAITGFMLDTADWKLLSILFFVVYILSFVFFAPLPNEELALTAAGLLSHWFSVALVWGMIFPFICLCFGLWLRFNRAKTFSKSESDFNIA